MSFEPSLKRVHYYGLITIGRPLCVSQQLRFLAFLSFLSAPASSVPCKTLELVCRVVIFAVLLNTYKDIAEMSMAGLILEANTNLEEWEDLQLARRCTLQK